MRSAVAALLLAIAVPAVADPWVEPKPLEALLARTDAIAKEVARLRGLPLKTSIRHEIVERAELHRRLAELAAGEKARAAIAAEGFAHARWGLIPLALDYEALLRDLLTEQIAGYYDPASDTLAISRAAVDNVVQAELVLAHEAVHALQDQAFDLEKFEDLPATEGDALLARRALVEGDGVALMIELVLARQGVRAPWSDPRVAEALDRGMTRPGNGDALDRAPLAIREALLFPYRAGATFVATLRRRSPWGAVDAAFATPPRSTEHILHPEKYLAGEAPIAVALTPPPSAQGFVAVHDSVWGELGFELFLESHGVDPRMAMAAANGWGGDRVITLARDTPSARRPERGLGIARLEWDSEVDAIEATEAAVRAVDRAVTGATIERGARTRWMDLDGTLAWVERRGTSLVIVLGAPAWSAESIAADIWNTSRALVP